ncbi:MAG TPA: hypothetical protein DCS93_17740 [Microscillaceae bacterium]|nr:hypothetical protein [Microscillaceae bacterium]
MYKTYSSSLFALISIVGFTMLTQNLTYGQTAQNNQAKIDEYVKGIMKRYGIPGAAVAVIRHNQVIHENYYGYANLEHQVAIQPKTIFPLLSTTKIPVTTAVFKLIEKGKFSLNDQIGTLIDGLPSSWQPVELKYLLAHASGLPDIVKYDKEDEKTAQAKTYKDKIVFPKGASFHYNQTNFWILTKIIEKYTQEKFEAHVLRTQFKKDNPSVLFSTNMLDIIANRATRYTFFNDRKTLEVDTQVNGAFLNSCNGLNLSLPEFIQWSKRFAKGDFISQTSKNKMWKKFKYSQQGPKFAYGWEIHPINDHLSYGFSGGHTTAYRTFPNDGLSIIWLTNGLKKQYSTDPIINYIAGIVNKELYDPTTIALESVNKLFFEKSLKEAISGYYKIKKANPQVNFNKTLFGIASGFLNDNQPQNSIKVYDLNIAEYPKGWIGYYGRANAHRKNKDFGQAVQDYKKAATLNPNEADQKQLRKMAADLEEKIKKH